MASASNSLPVRSPRAWARRTSTGRRVQRGFVLKMVISEDRNNEKVGVQVREGCESTLSQATCRLYASCRALRAVVCRDVPRRPALLVQPPFGLRIRRACPGIVTMIHPRRALSLLAVLVVALATGSATSAQRGRRRQEAQSITQGHAARRLLAAASSPRRGCPRRRGRLRRLLLPRHRVGLG